MNATNRFRPASNSACCHAGLHYFSTTHGSSRMMGIFFVFFSLPSSSDPPGSCLALRGSPNTEGFPLSAPLVAGLGRVRNLYAWPLVIVRQLLSSTGFRFYPTIGCPAVPPILVNVQLAWESLAKPQEA